MDAKELKKLRRRDLLEILVTLYKENDQLKQQLAQAQEMLEQQKTVIANMESMSDISLRLSKMLETTKGICEQYSKDVRKKQRWSKK